MAACAGCISVETADGHPAKRGRRRVEIEDEKPPTKGNLGKAKYHIDDFQEDFGGEEVNFEENRVPSHRKLAQLSTSGESGAQRGSTGRTNVVII